MQSRTRREVVLNDTSIDVKAPGVFKETIDNQKQDENTQKKGSAENKAKSSVKKGECPLCNKNIENPAFIMTSQKAYCYKC